MWQSTTAKTLKTAASLKSSSDVLEVVQKTHVEVQEDLQKTQEKLLKAVHQTQVQMSDAVQSTRSQTKENTTAFVDYSKRVWKISNWWRSPPQAVARGSKPKLLIAYSDTGGGHKASATAICAAFERLVPGQIEVKPVDVIEQYSLWPSNRTYSFFTSYPWLWGMIYKTTKQTHALGTDAQQHQHQHQQEQRGSAGAGDSAEAGGAAASAASTRISTQLAHASERYTDTPSSTLAKHLFDPAVSLEPFLLEGFIRCIQVRNHSKELYFCSRASFAASSTQTSPSTFKRALEKSRVGSSARFSKRAVHELPQLAARLPPKHCSRSSSLMSLLCRLPSEWENSCTHPCLFCCHVRTHTCMLVVTGSTARASPGKGPYVSREETN